MVDGDCERGSQVDGLMASADWQLPHRSAGMSKIHSTGAVLPRLRAAYSLLVVAVAVAVAVAVPVPRLSLVQDDAPVSRDLLVSA